MDTCLANKEFIKANNIVTKLNDISTALSDFFEFEYYYNTSSTI